MTSRTHSSSSKRPSTPPKSSDRQQQAEPPVPPIPNRSSTTTTTTTTSSRRTLGFLRRSRSGDPVRKMPVVSPAAPKLPDLKVNGHGNSTGFPNHLIASRSVRDSVEILRGGVEDEPESNSHRRSQHPNAAAAATAAAAAAAAAVPGSGFVPGRKSTDSVIGPAGEYIKSSSVPISEDPYANIGSMAHRGRYSYASSAVSSVNSPRRVRRRKDPTPFNVLVIGARNSGKTSFLRFLGHSLSLKKRGQAMEQPVQTDHTGTISESAFKSTYIETEIDGERIGLTLWDSAGLEKSMVDLQLRETVAFIEAKFTETFNEETKVVRAPGIRDTHIHCVFLLLDPARLTPGNHYLGKVGSDEPGGLDPNLDISVLKALHGKTVVVPVISKADTCTSKHMEYLKEVVRKGLAAAKEDPLESLELEAEDDDMPVSTSKRRGNRGSLAEEDDEDDEFFEADEDQQQQRGGPISMSAGLNFIPLSIISPDSYDPSEPLGRHFAWGFADPYNETHCDFIRLRDSVFSEWRAELREKSRESWYENWRSERLGSRRRRP